MIGGRRCAALVGLMSLVVWPSPGDAQPYFYPMRGQSQQQEEEVQRPPVLLRRDHARNSHRGSKQPPLSKDQHTFIT